MVDHAGFFITFGVGVYNVVEECLVPEGKVKKVVSEKGFGFIEGPDGADVFFHQSHVAESGFGNLVQGQRVAFEVEQGGNGRGKGPRAVSVKPL